MTDDTTTDNHNTETKQDIKAIEDKFRTIHKALELLSNDLHSHVNNPEYIRYFVDRINYLYGVAAKRDIGLITHAYLRSLYALFNNYYLKFQSPLPGEVVSPDDKERHLIYSEIDDRLQDFQLEY